VRERMDGSTPMTPPRGDLSRRGGVRRAELDRFRCIVPPRIPSAESVDGESDRGDRNCKWKFPLNASVASVNRTAACQNRSPSIIAPARGSRSARSCSASPSTRFMRVRVHAYVPAWIANLAAGAGLARPLVCAARQRRLPPRGTPFQPWRPTRAIAAQDIYARTRNPMYQGFSSSWARHRRAVRSDGAVLMLIARRDAGALSGGAARGALSQAQVWRSYRYRPCRVTAAVRSADRSTAFRSAASSSRSKP
jgi:hypothetical protein